MTPGAVTIVRQELHIKIASPEVSEAIAAVIREAFAEFETCYTPEAFAATVISAEKIRERFREGAIWTALKNEKMVGTVSTRMESERLYIRSMAILPGEQGGGIGRALLERVENFALENGFRFLFLYTTPFLHGAIRLYERNGFERGTIETDGFFGTPWLRMEKKLDKTGKL